MNEVRITEVNREEEWKVVPLSEVKKGDRFRMFEPDGEPVKNVSGDVVFVAHEDSFLGPHGPNETQVWTVITDK